MAIGAASACLAPVRVQRPQRRATGTCSTCSLSLQASVSGSRRNATHSARDLVGPLNVAAAMSLLRVLTMALATGVSSALGAADLVSLAQKGDPDAVLRSIADGAKVDAESGKGHLPLVAAVQKGDAATAAALLQSRANPTAIERSSGQSAVTAAFAAGNSELASLLLAYGADPDAKDKLGKSARELAQGTKAIGKLLDQWDAAGAAGFEDAPGAWVKHADEKSGVAFYHNAATKASQYAPPPSCAWSKGYVEGKPVYTNSVTRQRVWMTPKALAWKVLRSKTEDRYFWFNYATNFSTREVPAELPEDLVAAAQFDSGAYYANGATKATSWADPAEGEWRQVTSPDHKQKFWFNPKTAEAAWERPAEQAWRAAPSTAHGGTLFYFNEVTKESVWDKPEALAWEKHIYSAHLDPESGL